MTETLENTKKRLIFRSWHRGTKEMDILMGSFAQEHVPDFNQDEVSIYDEMLELSDPDLYNWYTKREEIPANLDNAVMQKFLAHKPVKA